MANTHLGTDIKPARLNTQCKFNFKKKECSFRQPVVLTVVELEELG